MLIAGPNVLKVLLTLAVVCIANSAGAEAFDHDNIPLPEHPRPDFQRAQWLNLNGPWQFRFDTQDKGQKQEWFKDKVDFDEKILVPFPWGSKLSGVNDEADIGWYRRDIDVPQSWQGERVFLVIGACDWHTTAWLNGTLLGQYQGGYTPFEFDLTPYLKPGKTSRLILRVDDTDHRFKLQGKQGYGRAAGIWQTAYLEARPKIAFETIHFSPDIDKNLVSVKIALDKPAPADMKLQLRFKANNLAGPAVSRTIAKGAEDMQFDVPIAKPRLWSLEDPYLYEVTALLQGDNSSEDRVDTYFGMRKISVANLPGTSFPYIALNNKPIYLQTTLDQAYHPEGFYTFPSDEFMRDEILRTRRIGLNGQRIHIKVEVPRKLYWADRLGVLIMADVPNSWGPPDAKACKETETALRGMIRRDYNHPSIFSWVNFNETWGLTTRGEGYAAETQEWVASIYKLTKQLDPTRLVEDNSTNKLDHVITDINSWHAYLPGHRWRDVLDLYCERTYPGSGFNFIGENKQGSQPMMNSECGNVWGYEGEQGGHPTGDIDWSWDYHMMMNEFRRHPKCCGWLYTEHHDVINEWNGYWRYDRSDKVTGLGDLAAGMTLNDLHSPFYLATEERLCSEVKPGETIQVPLYASFLTDQPVGSTLTLKTKLYGWDALGQKKTYSHNTVSVPYKPWMSKELEPLKITMPDKSGVVVLTLTLQSAAGNVLSRNFTTYHIFDGPCAQQETIKSGGEKMKVIRFGPDTFKKADWSLKQWNVMDGLKVNGTGSGYFEYDVHWPEDLKASDIAEATLLMELSAKQLYGKDRKGAKGLAGNFMLGEGTHDPGRSPNSYPMTDETPFPSAVSIYVADSASSVLDLADDPADHRGILSWHSQVRDYSKPDKDDEDLSFKDFKGGQLQEAGSYGYLIEARISPDALRKAQMEGVIRIRLEVDDSLSGGLAIYGARFGRYPLDPTLTFVLKN